MLISKLHSSDIISLIEEEAINWYSRYGQPPRFAFVKPEIFSGLSYEATLADSSIYNNKYRDTVGRDLLVTTSVGALIVKPDSTIDDVDVTFVSSNENMKYADYITEKSY